MSQSKSKGLFYNRDSGGRHEMTPGEYVLWAQRRAQELDVLFTGTPEEIEAMIREGRSMSQDIYLDYGISGNVLSRPGLDGLINKSVSNSDVTHIFIPRRDRLARPDDPLDGVRLEQVLQNSGVTLVFMDRISHARPKGSRANMADLIMAMLDYDRSGQDRRDLAQKILFAQIRLAKGGFSTGGRAPYGFRRWLAKGDGTPVRELQDGERVKMAGHHVVWLPTASEDLNIVHKILELLKTMPACRVAEQLNREDIPSPDAGRFRTDNGIKHQVSGLWHQPTVTNIARNPLLLAITSYGTRSMGDQLRFTPEGPRPLESQDYRNDEKPKVIRNKESERITSSAHFEPLVDPNEHQKLIASLDKRAGTQRGKPRSKDPAKNPLGSRIYDMNCSWPMYREPYQDSFRYKCGYYIQSHGASCAHNHVPGDLATQFVLSCIRQRLLSPTLLPKLKQRLEELAKSESPEDSQAKTRTAKTAELAHVQKDLKLTSQNMALAKSPEQFEAVAEVFNNLKQQEAAIRAELVQIQEQPAKNDAQSEVKDALDFAKDLVKCVDQCEDYALARQLFESTNAKLFLSFRPTKVKKRTLNKLVGGVLTFGAAPAPIEVYTGLTGQKHVEKAKQQNRVDSSKEESTRTSEHFTSGEEEKSLRNVSRGFRNQLELFVQGIEDMDPGVRHLVLAA